MAERVTTARVFEFEVVFRNDRMGFAKTFRVEETAMLFAVSAAYEQLKDKGYDAGEFAVIMAERGREVGT